MLDAFVAWFQTESGRLRDAGFSVAVTRPAQKTDRNGAYADIVGGPYYARVGLWETGECDREVLDSETGKTLSWEHSVVGSVDELQSALTGFCHRLVMRSFGHHG